MLRPSWRRFVAARALESVQHSNSSDTIMEAHIGMCTPEEEKAKRDQEKAVKKAEKKQKEEEEAEQKRQAWEALEAAHGETKRRRTTKGPE